MIIISLAKRSLVCSVSAFCTIHSIAFCTIHSISAFCTIPILSTELKWNYVKKSVINFVLTSMLLYTVCFLTQLLKVDLWCSHFVSTLTQLLFLSPSYKPQRCTVQFDACIFGCMGHKKNKSKHKEKCVFSKCSISFFSVQLSWSEYISIVNLSLLLAVVQFFPFFVTMETSITIRIFLVSPLNFPLFIS